MQRGLGRGGTGLFPESALCSRPSCQEPRLQPLGSHQAPRREGGSLPRSKCADPNSSREPLPERHKARLFQALFAPPPPPPGHPHHQPPSPSSRTGSTEPAGRSGTGCHGHVTLASQPAAHIRIPANPSKASQASSEALGVAAPQFSAWLRAGSPGETGSQSRRRGSPLGDPQIWLKLIFQTNYTQALAMAPSTHVF